ncbi:MAG: amidohydrolase family protein [Flavobacteriales bacterium]|jgi:imidazolonepropionase-like amidohydrolase
MNYTKNMRGFILLLVIIVSAASSYGQTPTPGKKQEKSIIYINATVHIGDGTKVLKGAVGFDNGLISYVGATPEVRKNLFEEVIDVEGMHIYPGFIAPNSTLGLQEIGSVRATRDQREVGDINPHIRSLIAFQTESDITTTVRTNGILLGQITPRGSFVGGQSSVVHFDGWNWEDALIRESDGIHVYWPRMYERDHTGKLLSLKERGLYQKRVEALEEYLDQAKAYQNRANEENIDLRLQAFSKLFKNKMNLYVHAQTAKQMTAAISLKRKYNIEKMLIVGGRESHLITNLLKENNVGVMVGRLHDLPWNDYDDLDLPYKLPKILQDAGVKWCFENAGDMEQMNSRNLPFYAGTAIAYGLEYEQAVAGLTLNTAEMIGVSTKYGSLQVGKSATLIVSKGDALDMMTNNIIFAYIDGRSLELTNRQIGLYKKYKKKYSN